MGDSRKWAAEYEDDLYGMANAIDDNETAHDFALYIKELMSFSENTPLTVKQRNDIEMSINMMLKVLADIARIDLDMNKPNMREVLEKI